MSFKSKINHYRRTVMKSLTSNVKNGNQYKKVKFEDLKIEKVLISRPNQRLGNTLLITPLVQEIINLNPNVTIDLFVKGGVSHVVFENYPQVDQIIKLPKKPFKELVDYIKVWLKIRQKNYDLVINVHEESASGRISTKVSRAKYKLFGNEFLSDPTDNNQVHLAKLPVYQFRKFIESVTDHSITSAYPKLNLKLSAEELQYGKGVLSDLVPDPSKKTIAFFTYATGSKCYEANWWTNFYNDFYPKYAGKYNLIEILPVENISMLNHKLLAFYSQDIREIAAVMENCEILIAADSGMMHLGCATTTKNIGLFKSGNYHKYKPYGEGNSMVLVEDHNHIPVIDALDKILK